MGIVLADKYRVVRQIGRGGMGIVYEAEHVTLGKRVAIKLMLEKYADDTEAIARFQREALAASRIGNPHIIDVSDIGTAPDGRSFVVMELLLGSPLSHVIETAGPLPPWRAVHIMRQVLRAVGAAHAKGIVHRDLKPDNIFIVNQDDHHDFVKLLDFGISKVLDLDEQVAFTKLTTTGVVMGTPLYMAPEQAMGHTIERYADIYACGVILYEMLAGRPPFEGATYAVLVAKLLTADPPLLSDVRPGLPGALVRAVHMALEKDPKDRVQSAEKFAAMLPGDKTPSMLELAGTLDSSSGVAVALPTEKRVRRRWPVYVAGVGLAAAAAITAVVLMNQQGKPAATASAAPTAPAQAAITASAAAPATTTAPNAPTAAASADATLAAVGILQVKSVPTGAAVTIDGNPVGVTPIEITLSPRRYQVKVMLEGFDTIESEEDVRTRERSSVVLQLQKTVAQRGSRGSRPKPAIRSTSAVAPLKRAPQVQPNAKVVDPLPEPAVKPKADDSKPVKTPAAGTKPNPY
ncbi:MAG: serine/threonine protein kinase [Deltaproteobacteria bacterium]|nr:serine/threonine protein kinase [Deltaproteobacteria bacterium]MDQ3295537.1 protein kinase [Myxococcota bacterium]